MALYLRPSLKRLPTWEQSKNKTKEPKASPEAHGDSAQANAKSDETQSDPEQQ
jgi:hypothetical protein